MWHTYLIGKRELEDEEHRTMQLDYYLLECTRGYHEDTHLYGIQITKTMENKGQINKEQETTPAISYSRNFVEQMILKLIECQVTPLSMLEIVDDLIGEY